MWREKGREVTELSRFFSSNTDRQTATRSDHQIFSNLEMTPGGAGTKTVHHSEQWVPNLAVVGAVDALTTSRQEDGVTMLRSPLPSTSFRFQDPNSGRSNADLPMTGVADPRHGFFLDEAMDAGQRDTSASSFLSKHTAMCNKGTTVESVMDVHQTIIGDNVSQGWAAKDPLPGLSPPTVALHPTALGTKPTSTTSSIEGRVIPTSDGNLTEEMGGENSRPSTAAVASLAGNRPLIFRLPATPVQTSIDAVQPNRRAVGGEGGWKSVIKTPTTRIAIRRTEGKDRKKKGRARSSGSRPTAAANEAITVADSLPDKFEVPPVATRAAAAAASHTSTATKKAAARTREKPPENWKKSTGKTFQQRRGGCCGMGSDSTATIIPEFDIYSSNNKSCHAESKRRAFFELAEADMDRVNLERDFAVKNARFDRARVAHMMVHERWTKTRSNFEGTSEAANVYFVAQQVAERRLSAARHNRRTAKAGVKQAEDSWALAHAEAGEAVKIFRAKDAAKTKAAALLRAFKDEEEARTVKAEAVVMATIAAAAAVKVSGTRESSASHDGLVSAKQLLLPNNRKRSLSDTDDGIPDATPGSATAIVVTKEEVIHQRSGADIQEGGGCDVGGSVKDDGNGSPPSTKRRSTAGVGGAREEEERRSLAKALQAERVHRACMTSHAANAAAHQPAVTDAAGANVTDDATDALAHPAVATATALDVAFEAATSELLTASGKVVHAIEKTGMAAAELALARIVFDLDGATRAEAETLKARQDAVDEAWPYVAWVNQEVDAERRLQALSRNLRGAASATWDARESARKALNEAGERISRAVLALKRFSWGDRIDMGRHTLFKAVVEEKQHQRQQQQRWKNHALHVP